jgi:hypothetical protein
MGDESSVFTWTVGPTRATSSMSRLSSYVADGIRSRCGVILRLVSRVISMSSD